MALTAGTKLGPYEVVSSLGAGGMGEVYRARDTRLNRTVAIKALHAAVVSDPERVARFEREAQLLASLNHPNIGAIYGLQEADGSTYLVLEFVDGRSLDQILRDVGALDIQEALTLARQIADAVAAAHERGIVHRDLKPGNVMVTADGQVKVLDFGLAKALDAAHGGTGADGSAGANAANSPTMTLAGTQAGVILGTAGYMSPEQAKGRVADKRSDVWAFGCVLFEMLSGRRAFEGEDITDILAAIVRGEPDWKALPASLPPAIRSLIERCLVKDRTQRMSDMSVVRYVLNEPATMSRPVSAAEVAAPAERAGRTVALPVAAALILLALAAGATIARMWPEGASEAAGRFTRLTIVLPDGDEVVSLNMAPLAVAPDGTAIVYVGLRAGKSQLYLRELGAAEPKPLDGTDGARSPFFSPDGRWIAFFAKSKLKRITVGGTALQDVADASDSRGGTWSADDAIYFAPANTSGLWKVSASGGQAVELTHPDSKAGEISHRWPQALPGGQALLFSVWTGPGIDEHRIERLWIADGRREVLVRNVEGPAAAAGGYLLHGGRLDDLLVVPWQPGQTSVKTVEPIALPIEARANNEGASAYAVSNNATIAYVQGGRTRRMARIVWIDRKGRMEALPVPDRDYVSAVISPDGRQAVLQIRVGTEELWMYDFASRSFTPFVITGGSSQGPLWSADGKYVIYRGTRGGYRNLYRKAADGTGGEERLTTKPNVLQTPTSVSADGKWLVFLEGGGYGGGDIWKLSLDDPTHSVSQLVATPDPEHNGQVSPDGRWLAYESTVSGRGEVWVQPFDASGPRRQISREGGTTPRWSRDGRELFFTALNGIMAVSVSGNTFGAPALLFEGRYRAASNANTNYDVARDGRFLHVQQIQPDRAVTRIEVALNAFAGVRK